MENLNYFDIVILGLSAILGIKGLFRGIIKEVFSLLGIIGGIFLASRLAPNISDYINEVIKFSNSQMLQLVSFLISFVFIWLVMYLLGNIVSKIISLSGLGIFDRFIGFVFGGAKVFLLFSVIFYAISNIKALNDKISHWTDDSLVYPILIDTGKFIIKLDIDEATKNIKKNINDATDIDNATKKIKENINSVTNSAKDMVKKSLGE